MRSPKLLALSCLALLVVLCKSVPVAAQGVPMPTRGVTVQIRLGLQDKEATAWDGRLEVVPGRLLALVGPTRRGDRVGEGSWRLRTRPAGGQRGQQQRIQPVVLRATLDGPPTAVVKITTPQGAFSFALGDLRPGQAQSFLEDQASVQQVPLTTRLTAEPAEEDFPSAAAAPDGTIWLAYTSYQQGNPLELPEDASIPDDWSSFETKGNGDLVRLRHFDGAVWSEPINVTAELGDVWKPTVAVNGEGEVLVIWSQKMRGNWDLYWRRWDPRGERWSSVRRLTEAPGADLDAVCAVGSDGTVHVAWRGWRGDNFDILHTVLPDGARASETTVSSSRANDWSPDIAVDSGNTVYVAWDTYDRGNYDVMLRAIPAGGRARLPKAVPVAATSRFEARPSLACDSQDRLWVAFEVAAPQWGKDFGSVWKGPSGVPFYLDREVAVRCVVGSQVRQTKGRIVGPEIDTRYPPSKRMRLSMPQLCLDERDRVWVVYRRHPLETGAGTRWDSYATCLLGEAWSEPIHLPNSGNLLDNWPVLLPLKGTGLLVIHSSDGRGGGASSGNNDVYAAIVPAPDEVSSAALEPVPKETVQEQVVHPSEVADIRRMRNRRVKIGGKTYQLLRGEFHRHTAYTSHRDQDGPFAEMWRYGLDVARMDWIGNGDHDNGGGREYSWWIIQKHTDFYFHPPTFIPMFTYERSVRYPSGHRNAMFDRRGIRPLPRAKGDDLMGDPETGSPDIKRFYAYLKFFDGICASHTSATNMGTDWRDNDPAVEPVVEIYQGHRQNYEEPNAPMSATDASDSIGGYRAAGYVWNALAKGYRLGFQVSSDHVSTHLSYAVTLAESPTREAILDAFKKRHCYGATDNMILIARCGDHLMGDQFASDTPPTFKVTAVGTGPIARIAVVRDNEYVYSCEPNRRQVEFTWRDLAPKSGQSSYYYFRVEQANGALAWASPMWVRYEGA